MLLDWVALRVDIEVLLGSWGVYPDTRKDLKSRFPQFGTLATIGYLIGTPLRDLLFGSSRGSGYTGSWQVFLLLGRGFGGCCRI